MSAGAMLELTACPECSAPAEITERVTFRSTHGPVEHARVRCVRRHWFFLPVARLLRGLATEPRDRSAEHP
jgi:hypothetical protein